MNKKRSFTGQHRFFHISKSLPYQYCCKCGIVTLRNKATWTVINKPCKDRDKDED